MLRTEFHCHTIYSKDSLTTPEQLLDACQRKGINRVVVTDHNTIAGALCAQRLDPERVIVGEEILTTQGELLAAYVNKEIPPGLEPREAIDRLRQQGAFITVPHPFDVMRHGWKLADLLAITPLVDAIEVFNARSVRMAINQKAKEFAQRHNLSGTVGSDAHTTFELGRAILLLPVFSDVDSLRYAIQRGSFVVQRSPVWVHLASRYATWYKKLKSP